MSDVVKFRSLAEIEQEAAAWVWRLDDEALLPEEQAEFEKWLRRDPRHRRSFDELGGVWRSLDQLAEAKRDERIAAFQAQERRLLGMGGSRRARVRRWVAAAAVVFLGVIGTASWLRQGSEGRMLATAVGQQHSTVLADGSTVQLNTNSVLETSFEPARRLVHLRKGEAVFKVAHDPDRPFVVQAGDMAVRAIGTEFNVRLHEGEAVEVIVTEGRVAVEPWGGSAGTPATAPKKRELVAGQRLRASAEAPVSEVGPGAITKTLAWREGAIVFDGEPLTDAIAELNRYTDKRVVLADPALYQMRIGGRFRAGDVDGFLEALTKALPVTTQRGADGSVRVHADPQRIRPQ